MLQDLPNWEAVAGKIDKKSGRRFVKAARQQDVIPDLGDMKSTVDVRFSNGTHQVGLLSIGAEGPYAIHGFAGEEGWWILRVSSDVDIPEGGWNPNADSNARPLVQCWEPYVETWLPESKRCPSLSIGDRSVFPIRVVTRLPLASSGRTCEFEIDALGAEQGLEGWRAVARAAIHSKFRKKPRKKSNAPPVRGSPLKRDLLTLVNDMDAIAKQFPEILDTEVRELMREAVFRGFILGAEKYEVPKNFGLFSKTGNAAVHRAICNFVEAATDLSKEKKLITSEARLAAFQDPNVKARSGAAYDDYFGHEDAD